MKLASLSACRRVSIAMALGLLLVGLAGCTEAPGTPMSPQSGNDANSSRQGMAETIEEGDPGIFDDRILFGQSAAFTGPTGEPGTEMRLGIQAAFHEANQNGGVYGRELELETLNDSYETDFAFANTQTLIEKNQVFALIGAVGTPTSRAASPLADAAGVPFIAPFTGAEFLRDPELDNVFNLRASYFQETEEMVARLTEDLAVTRVAVLYQDDSYAGLCTKVRYVVESAHFVPWLAY